MKRYADILIWTKLEDIRMNKDNKLELNEVQPKTYSQEEIKKLKSFIETVKNDQTRSALACWGNHNDFTKGY